MWKLMAFIGNNIMVEQIIWEGLWMNCIVQSTGQMQCKVDNSRLVLPQDLQAAHALVVISVLLSLLALLVSVVGTKCTNCMEDEGSKARIMIVSRAIFASPASPASSPSAGHPTPSSRTSTTRWCPKLIRGSWGPPSTSAGLPLGWPDKV
ncbi:Claudin-4 [Chelonia mydas]|uniref:Claudin n=1 Tax=Chelonia mydas TaxID=8469 RepID=M7BRU4_CHEMY|nr:Claudin-4 [Chelonia mydas]